MFSLPVYIVVLILNGNMDSVTAPYLRRTSTAAFSVVPASSIIVSGRDVNVSVSLHAIQVKRGESLVACVSRPAVTNMYRATPSVDPHPTHEPVLP